MNHSCFLRSPWHGTALITYSSKRTKWHHESTVEFLTPDKTYTRNRRRIGTRSRPHSLLRPKWQASWYSVSMQGLVWVLYLHKSFFFYYPALLTEHSFLKDGFIDSALKDCKITGPIDIAIDCSSFIYVCMVMLLYWWVFTRTMRAVNRHR